MLKTIGWMIKAAAFALIVLVIGNYFHVGNKTISDQVKTQLSHAERSDVLDEVKDWAHQVTSDQKAGISKKLKAQGGRHLSAAPTETETAVENAVPRVQNRPRIAPQNALTANQNQPTAIKTADEEIPSSERQKLRTLMRELNSARVTN